MWVLLLVLWGLPVCQTLPPGAQGKRGDANPPPQLYQKSWAVVVGINTYRHPTIPALSYAIKDAESVRDALHPLGFPREHILVLKNAEASKVAIEAALYRQTGAEDRLLVFFAGHGQSVPRPKGAGDEGFLLPYDADPANLPSTAILMEDLRRIGTRIEAKHILFIVDACHSGFAVTRRNLPATSYPPTWLQSAAREPVTEILTAGRKGEQAVEEHGHGVFTTHLLKGLEKFADSNNDKVITTAELHVFIEERVRRDSGGMQNPQYGKLQGEGQFLFLLPGFGSPAGTADGPTTTVSPQMPPTTALTRPLLPQAAPLPLARPLSPASPSAVQSLETCNDLRVKMSLGVEPLSPEEQNFLRSQCQR